MLDRIIVERAADAVERLGQCLACAQVPCRSTISGTTAWSFSGTRPAMIPAVPSGSRLLTRPSSSLAPAGASTPASQLDRTSRYGARFSRSKS